MFWRGHALAIENARAGERGQLAQCRARKAGSLPADHTRFTSRVFAFGGRECLATQSGASGGRRGGGVLATNKENINEHDVKDGKEEEMIGEPKPIRALHATGNCAPTGSLPFGRRCRHRKDDHRRASHPRARTSRPGRSNPDRLSCQPQRSVVTRAHKGDVIRDQFGVNQWLEQKRVITSLDSAKRPKILPGLKPARGRLVIVDEAPLPCRHRTQPTRACATSKVSFCGTPRTFGCC